MNTVPGLARAALILAAAILLSSCAADPPPDGPLVTHRGPWNGEDALGIGELSLEGNCLYFTVPGSFALPDRRPATPRVETRMILAFARGADWDAATSSVHYDDSSISVGPNVRIGGGIIEEDKLDGWENPPDPSCAYDATWYVSDHGPQPAR
jgi:hypothetical protein